MTFRRARSLKQAVVSNMLPSETDNAATTMWLKRKNGFIKCTKCKACTFGVNTSSYTSSFARNQHVKIRGQYSCKTDFAVYVLQCPWCLRYVGSTILPVHKSVLQHLRALKNGDRSYPVARHFDRHHGKDVRGLSYFVIDAVPPSARGGDREKKLRKLESSYIIKLNSKTPEGLNMEEDLHTHL